MRCRLPDRAISGAAAARAGRSGGHPERGLDAAGRGAGDLRSGRGARLPEARGGQPDGKLQGSGDDASPSPARRARAPRRSSAPRPGTPRRAAPPTRRAPACAGAVIVPEGRIAIGKLAQALIHGARVIALRGNFDQALEIVRELAEAPPGRAGQLGQSVPDRGSEDGRVRGLRRARRAAGRARDPGRERRQHHRLVARLSRIRGGAGAVRLPGRGRGAAGARQAGAPSRRRSRRRSGSATRLAGRRRWTRSPAHAGGSRRSPTSRSSTPTNCSPRARASSASRRPRRRSPGSWLTGCRLPKAASRPTSVVCVLTGHGLKDPDTALGKAPSVIGCEAELGAVERVVFDD